MNPDPDPTRQLLYQLMAENRQHARLSEDRRILISTATLLAGTAILIALVVSPPGLRTLPLALWLTALGLLGALLCLKLYERAQFHERRARALRTRLIELTPSARADEVQQEAEADHIRDYPRLATLRLNAMLIAVNIVIALFGLLYAVLAVLHMD